MICHVSISWLSQTESLTATHNDGSSCADSSGLLWASRAAALRAGPRWRRGRRGEAGPPAFGRFPCPEGAIMRHICVYIYIHTTPLYIYIWRSQKAALHVIDSSDIVCNGSPGKMIRKQPGPPTPAPQLLVPEYTARINSSATALNL